MMKRINDSKMGSARRAHAAKWNKDGRWHVTVPYTPTAKDRACFPVSYPHDDPGPFFIWSDKAYETEAEALAAIGFDLGDLPT